MANTGTASLNFGAFPGSSDANIAITGQSGILSTSYVEAWIMPVGSTDHSADEHFVETIKIVAGNISAGVGFTIYGLNTNNLFEPIAKDWTVGLNGNVGPGAQDTQAISMGGSGTRIYGVFTISWVWN